jgi:hypothetical protein
MLWPRPEEVSWDVDAPPEAVIEAVRRNAHTGSRFVPFVRQPFRGRVFRDGFLLRRVVMGRNNFLPEITGTVDPRGESGSLVVLRFRLNTFSLVFPVVWFGMLGQFLMIALYLLVAEGHLLPVAGVLLLGAFGFALVRWGYRHSYPREVRIAIDALGRILAPLGVYPSSAPRNMSSSGER